MLFLMALPRMPFVVVDTNRVRRAEVIDPLIEEFHRSGQVVVLPWTATYEFYKHGNLESFHSSIEQLSKEPDAVAFARASMDVFQKIEVPFRRVASDIIAHDGTKALRAMLRDYRDGVLDDAAARRALNRPLAQATHLVAPWEPLFRSAASFFGGDKAERADIYAQLRAGDRTPFREVVHTIFSTERITELLQGMPIRGRAIGHVVARRLARLPSFAALMILAAGARAYEWVLQKGVETSKGLINDGVDIENVLIALYGRGFVSIDKRAVELYEDLVAIAATRWR
jgi:hypothetical protein